MALPTITPAQARHLLADGAVPIDVREPHEYAREHIAGAVNKPLSALGGAGPASSLSRRVVFYCRSGARTRAHAQRLAAAANSDCEAYVLAGGIDAWRAAGFPTRSDGQAAGRS